MTGVKSIEGEARSAIVSNIPGGKSTQRRRCLDKTFSCLSSTWPVDGEKAERRERSQGEWKDEVKKTKKTREGRTVQKHDRSIIRPLTGGELSPHGRASPQALKSTF